MIVSREKGNTLSAVTSLNSTSLGAHALSIV